VNGELTSAPSDALIDMLLETPDMALFLQRLVDLSSTELHQAHCSLTLWRKRRPATVCSTDAVTAALDELQYAAGQGPCMEAVRRHQIVEVLDFRTETRWPRYVSAMVDGPMRSVLAVPIANNRNEKLRDVALSILRRFNGTVPSTHFDITS
jgi:hypothetical protein